MVPRFGETEAAQERSVGAPLRAFESTGDSCVPYAYSPVDISTTTVGKNCLHKRYRSQSLRRPAAGSFAPRPLCLCFIVCLFVGLQRLSFPRARSVPPGERGRCSGASPPCVCCKLNLLDEPPKSSQELGTENAGQSFVLLSCLEELFFVGIPVLVRGAASWESVR